MQLTTNEPMSRFSVQVENILTEAGWYPGRERADLVASWKATLMDSDGFEMFPSAERVLLEFGGLNVDQEGQERLAPSNLSRWIQP